MIQPMATGDKIEIRRTFIEVTYSEDGPRWRGGEPVYPYSYHRDVGSLEDWEINSIGENIKKTLRERRDEVQRQNEEEEKVGGPDEED